MLALLMPIESAASTQAVQNPVTDRSCLYVVIAQVVVVLALIAALFISVLADMAHDWWIVPALSQGMLLPPLALYIAWIERRRILAPPAVRDSRGLLLTAFACITYILGRLSSEFFLMRFSFVILLAGLAWTFWGLGRLRRLALPLLLLASMVPLPVVLYNSIAVPLQLLASEGAAQIAQSMGVSVFRDGNVIQLAGITLGVAEACSGLNALSSLVVGSLLLGYLFCSHWAARTLLILASVPLAIGVNVLRVAGTAILADYNQDFALGFYHTFSGWLIFVVGLGFLYLTARALHVIFDRKPSA